VAGFDVTAARRWARLDARRTLAHREDATLPFARLDERAGQSLLLDTCVYIDQMQGRAPNLIERLVDARQINHSTVAIQALRHTIGVLDPDDPRTAAVTDAVTGQIQAMPEHRLFTPDAEVLGRAALLVGILSRLQGYARDARLRTLQDCVLFLQARKLLRWTPSAGQESGWVKRESRRFPGSLPVRFGAPCR
jgi:hypothetical protein